MDRDVEPLKLKNNQMEMEHGCKVSDHQDNCKLLEEYKAMVKTLEDNLETSTVEVEIEQICKLKEDALAKMELYQTELKESETKLAMLRDEKSAYESAAAEIKVLQDKTDGIRREIDDQNVALQQQDSDAALVSVHRKLRILTAAAAMLSKTAELEKDLESDHSKTVDHF
jgi:hypothetical protein